MATASKKIEASPFLVRRAEVLQKLQANKQWLEESFKRVKELDDPNDRESWNHNHVTEWMTENWDKVVDFIKKKEDINIDGNWHQNYSVPGSRMTIIIDPFDIEGYPKRESYTNNKDLIPLRSAIQGAFQVVNDNKGQPIPSRYQKICQHIALFEQSTEEFIDAKFYSDIPNLISDYKSQWESVQQIN